MKVNGSCHCGNIEFDAEIDTESGAKRVQAFCPVCGTPLYSSAEGNPTHMFVRVGTIRQRASLRPTVQIWRRSAVKWLKDLDSVPGSPEQQALTA